MTEIQWVPAEWSEIHVGQAVRVSYPDRAVLMGRLMSEIVPWPDGAHVAQIDLGGKLGVLPVDVSGTRVESGMYQDDAADPQ